MGLAWCIFWSTTTTQGQTKNKTNFATHTVTGQTLAKPQKFIQVSGRDWVWEKHFLQWDNSSGCSLQTWSTLQQSHANVMTRSLPARAVHRECLCVRTHQRSWSSYADRASASAAYFRCWSKHLTAGGLLNLILVCIMRYENHVSTLGIVCVLAAGSWWLQVVHTYHKRAKNTTLLLLS